MACMKLFGSAEQLRHAEEAFSGTAAWAASLEAVLMAQGVVLGSLCTGEWQRGAGSGVCRLRRMPAAGPAQLHKWNLPPAEPSRSHRARGEAAT